MPSRAATSDWSNFASSRRPRIKSRRILRSLCLRAGRAEIRAIGREYTGMLTYIPKWTSTYWTIQCYQLLLDCCFGVWSKHKSLESLIMARALANAFESPTMGLTESIRSPRILANRERPEAVWCRVVDEGSESCQVRLGLSMGVARAVGSDRDVDGVLLPKSESNRGIRVGYSRTGPYILWATPYRRCPPRPGKRSLSL